MLQRDMAKDKGSLKIFSPGVEGCLNFRLPRTYIFQAQGPRAPVRRRTQTPAMADDAQMLEAELLAAFGPTLVPGAELPNVPGQELADVTVPLPLTSTSNLATVPAPKRDREEDESLAKNAKRLKTEHGEMEMDLGAMLQNALGTIADHAHVSQSGVEGSAPAGAPEVEPRAQSATVPAVAASPAAQAMSAICETSPAAEKIMKASENSLYMMRSMSLPVLGNIAVQILVRLSQQSRGETQALLADKDSEFGRAYEILKQTFTLIRKAFAESCPLLFADELEITDSEDRETLRMANLAAVGLSAFDTSDVPLEDIHDNFYTVFIPEETEYKEHLTGLYLDLKEYLYARSAPSGGDVLQGAIPLEKYFSLDPEESMAQRSVQGGLQPAEARLFERMKERRATLLSSLAGPDTNEPIMETPPWATESIEDGSFDATGLASFIAENLGPAIGNGPGVTEQQASAPLGQIPHGPNLLNKHVQLTHSNSRHSNSSTGSTTVEHVMGSSICGR
ncbi:hypothetical protein P8C59_006282 [Phyllachora maydis]|uniref:Telomere repeat-binding factor dimerisation domain-containing protein n=1 Tax=Phyllachora maydis TaxID=1825666 RepID=A0AAD9MGJ1_9PEZI|nr:hypothetical protein P8C59_006282 [Phyllachora maydis]